MKKLEEQSVILAIDDINYLSKNDANDLINELFRSNEFYHLNMALILTINDEAFKYSLERNAQSILLGHEIRFDDYTKDEIYSILKYRCNAGLKDSVISDEQLERISNYSYKIASLRRGLILIQVLGQMIESENRCKIENSDIDKYVPY
jgi:cell division control protein 6